MCRIMSDFLLVEALVVVARAWVARSCDVQVGKADFAAYVTNVIRTRLWDIVAGVLLWVIYLVG